MKPTQKSILGPKRVMHQSHRTILQRNTKPINGGGDYLLPIDLIIEIFSRLPAKFVARFCCLSKLLASRLRNQYFTELFLTRSLSCPQLLFTIWKGDELFFYSIPQFQNHDEKLSHAVATYVMKTPFARVSHTNGLVFLKQHRKNSGFLLEVCNPTTGKSLTVPKLAWCTDCYLVYDPIGKQYKLFSTTVKTNQVLTLGSGKLTWRKIKCGIEHSSQFNGICIGGVLYYLATVNNLLMLVRFDVCSEEFQFMDVTEKFKNRGATLINYDGKLGSIMFDGGNYFGNGVSKNLEIWVLEDPKKHEWSKHIHVLHPSLWKDVARDAFFFSIVGVIDTNEIVFRPHRRPCGNIYFLYYNMKKKSFVKVEIKGIEACMDDRMTWTFLNHVESLQLLF